jgi:hypothetical protein
LIDGIGANEMAETPEVEVAATLKKVKRRAFEAIFGGLFYIALGVAVVTPWFTEFALRTRFGWLIVFIGGPLFMFQGARGVLLGLKSLYRGTSPEEMEAVGPPELPDPSDLGEQAVKLIAEARRPIFARFLAYSHAVWKSGYLDYLSREFCSEANTTVGTFALNRVPDHLRMFQIIAETEPFDAREYLVSGAAGFMLTDRRLCFLTEDEPGGRLQIFALKDIARYEWRPTWSTHTVHLTLKDGRVFTLAKLKSVPHENYVNALATVVKNRVPSQCDAGGQS